MTTPFRRRNPPTHRTQLRRPANESADGIICWIFRHGGYSSLQVEHEQPPVYLPLRSHCLREKTYSQCSHRSIQTLNFRPVSSRMSTNRTQSDYKSSFSVGQDTHRFGAMYGITDYLLTILEEHPWAPTCPGQHGYVVVGQRCEKDLFKNGQCKHLFARVGKQYHYCGWYKMIIDEPLWPDEWVMLPPTVSRLCYQ